MMVIILVLVCGCGKATPGGKEEGKDQNQASTEKNASQDKDSEKEDSGKEDSGKDQSSDSSKSDTRMIEIANTCKQSGTDRLAFSDEYVYFTSSHDTYRCRYDGSDVKKLDKSLEYRVAMEGKLWGNWYNTGDAESGLYSIDTKSGDLKLEVPTSNRNSTVLVSGNWLCYAGEEGTALIVRDLTTGEEKTIATSVQSDRGTSEISMCIYGNTLYALINTYAGGYDCILGAYELGSGADKITEVCENRLPTHAVTAPIWMEEGILFPEVRFGGEIQYRYGKFEDIKDGKWDITGKEDNTVGTKGQEFIICKDNTSKYVMGNDFIIIDGSKVNYYPEMDFSAEKTLATYGEKNYSYGRQIGHGMYNGVLYIFLDKDSSSGAELLKITEGGNVEHIPVEVPES